MNPFAGLSPRRELIGWTAILAFLALVFAAGWWAGRRGRPVETKTVTVEKVKEVEREQDKTVGTVAVNASDAQEAHVRVVTRIVTQPGGAREVVRWRETGNSSTATVAAQETKTVYVDRWREAEKQQTTLTLTDSARWTLSLGVGSTIHWDRTYMGQISARILGPFSLGIFGVVANGKPAVGLTAGMRF